ncbi:unnamed protein product [Cuscuta campestris]|uniref:Uncharacterized protein n=1 Tax=Cuscuta campestris TaxID=132261 RepID=A0A484NK80_9ASTE|nr:unnamed protein product [Cuscuta campestris]
MPKQRRDRSLSSDRTRAFPYPSSSSRSRHSLQLDHLENNENLKEWEESRCPVCMEHPHNAILLLCASHDKGCRPYMCDTSYRHSNCFDQFKKSFDINPPASIHQDDITVAAPVISSGQGASAGSTVAPDVACESHEKNNMLCPFCRGRVNGWLVNEPARNFMNAKARSCSCETCDFNGTYADLRKHARLIHPLVRPTEADPERQRNWSMLERQRDFGDLLSTLNSSLGDDESEGSGTLTIDDGGLLTVFLFVRILQPRTRSRSSSSRYPSSRSRSQATFRRRPSRRLWGETFDGEMESRDDDNEDSDAGTATRRHQPTPET